MFIYPTRLLIPFRGGLFLRNYCRNAARSKVQNTNLRRSYGQPTFETHPHLLREGQLTPFITKSEYQKRRSNLIQLMLDYSFDQPEKNHLIVVPAATKQYMSDKIPYVFRQNTDFFYLTGCQEPDCCVIITVDAPSSYSTTLFTRDKDEHAELWDGPRTHANQASEFFGVDRSLPMGELESFIQAYRKSHPRSLLWYDIFRPTQKDVHKIVTDYMNANSFKKCENPKPFIHKLRLYKSPSEIALMQKSCDITSQAFIEAMSCSKPGIGENQIFAKIDYECRMRGAEHLAYPPVVAGGNRATIIHYINNNQLISDNEMVLVDAGCEFHGYSSDITRTWPVNGKFTPQQREIYEVVYSVQEELIQLCSSLPTLDALFETMCRLLGKKLQEIGLIGIQPSHDYLMKAAYQLCPHHVSHYLGMDIHDTPSINRTIKIEPGMVITVEPGVYISDKHKGLPKDYHGIGIRIEDDILITVNGPVVLSRKCPKHIDEIEKLTSKAGSS